VWSARRQTSPPVCRRWPDPGTLVVADGTRRQIGTLFEIEDLGPQPLAGFAEPQRAWHVGAHRSLAHPDPGSGASRAGGRARRSAHSRPTIKLPNSQPILQLVTCDNWGTCGMLRHCLIHPVAPLLSLLAPLFRPFFSPVRGVPEAATLRFKPLKSCGFCIAFRHRAGGKGVFRPVIRAKTGERMLSCRRATGIRIVRRAG
jgi:hypothetical protein